MAHIQHIYAYVLRPIFQALREEGIDPGTVVQRAGISADIVRDSSQTVTSAQYINFIRAARQTSQNPAIGLDIGVKTDLSLLGPVGYIELSAKTLYEAMKLSQRFQRYFRIPSVIDVARNITDADYNMQILLNTPQPDIHHILMEWGVIASSRRVEELLGIALKPKRVCLDYPPPSYAGQYEKLLGCEVLFDQPVTEICYPKTILDMPICGYDPDINKSILGLCERLTMKLQGHISISEEVCALIKERIGFFPDIERVAEKMDISSRTLRRLLANQNTSYQKLLDQCRREIAEDCLLRTKMTIAEVAKLCGFSEPQSFSKAFKKWSGKTPGEFRQTSLYKDLYRLAHPTE